jgi:hypothetical protein
LKKCGGVFRYSSNLNANFSTSKWSLFTLNVPLCFLSEAEYQ